MYGAGNFVCFFFLWQIFVAVLLDPCWCFEGRLGPLNGTLRGTG